MQADVRYGKVWKLGRGCNGTRAGARGRFLPMYTGVPHFDLKMLEADMILLSPKSVICTNSG
eukprot:COSAG02_NODE_2504_length_8663_cov_3.628211_10_plen_61_part_01